jgi:hypothetical protein
MHILVQPPTLIMVHITYGYYCQHYCMAYQMLVRPFGASTSHSPAKSLWMVTLMLTLEGNPTNVFTALLDSLDETSRLFTNANSTVKMTLV